MDLQTVHDKIRTVLRKATNTWFSPEEIDSAINSSQIDHFEQIKPAFASNQQVSDALKPFRKKSTFTTGNTASGLLSLPTDYYHLLVVSVVVVDSGGTTRHLPVEMVGDDELDDRRDSQLIPLSTLNPIGIFDENGKIQLYPDVPFAGTIRYLRRPLDCLFSYTQSGRVVNYDQSSSVQLEWNDAAIEKIIFKALQYLGVTAQDFNAVSFAQGKDAA
jgi:hypothetical protein